MTIGRRRRSIAAALCTFILLDEVFRAVPGGDVVGAGNGLATSGDYFVRHFLGGTGIGTGALVRAAEVVDDDTRAQLGKQQRVLTADAATGAGDEGNPVLH